MGTDQANPISKLAAADLSSSRYCAVTLNSSEKLALPSAGGAIIGILYNEPEADEHGVVYGPGSGQRKAKLGGTVTAGDKCKVDASGRFVTANAADIAAGAAVALCTEGGAVNEIGSVVMFGGAGTMALTEAQESPSGASANYDLNEYIEDHRITLGTANRTGALADGLYDGQRHRIRVVAASGGFTYTLTPATMVAGQPTSFEFTSLGQEVELTWYSDGYEVTGIKTAGTAAVADAGTINPLHQITTLAIGGAAEDRILPDGYVAGHLHSFMVTSDAGDTTISGKFYDEDGSADGTDLQIADAGDLATVVWDGARWNPISLTGVTVA